MTIRFKGLIAPTGVPTGDGRMFADGKMTYRPMPLPLMARFTSGGPGHTGATGVGSIDTIYHGPGGYWSDGQFLDPTKVPEVPRTIYLVQRKVLGPSVDLDQDFTVRTIPHPTRPSGRAGLFETYNVIGVTLVPMPAFAQVHLSVETDDERALLASLGVDTSGWGMFDINTHAWKAWPVAPRKYRFDADDAVRRIAHWAGVGTREPDLDRYASMFLWRRGDEAGDSLAQDSFRLPLADIVNGEPHLIYHAVYAAAALLSGGHGGLPNIPDEDKRRMVPVINEIYGHMARVFQDPGMRSPFAAGQGAMSIGQGREREENVTVNDASGHRPLVIDGVTRPVDSISITFVGDDAGGESGPAFAAGPRKPYGDVEYADPGYQDDGKARYPLDSEEHCRTAWTYINQADNAARYSPEELRLVRGRIIKALKRYGVDASETAAGEKVGEMSLLAGIAPLAPEAAWFRDPGLKELTRFTVTGDGRVFGHLAEWRTCHLGIGDRCVLAPRSRSGYRYFKVGELRCDDGSTVQVGKVTLGTGHAHERWGVIPSREHYDNTGWCAAIVNIGEDDHGIWVAGALTSTMDEERVATLRMSPLSGDWRRVEGNLELVAALAVNNPGFPVLPAYREEGGAAFSMMGVGVVGQEKVASSFSMGPEDDGELAARAQRLDEIDNGVETHFAAVRAAKLDEIDKDRRQLADSAESGMLRRQLSARLTVVSEE
jgi:hypothetical protein